MKIARREQCVDISVPWKQRMRLALAILVVFCGVLVLLAVQQNREYHEEVPSAFDYLLDADSNMPDDPLGISSPDLELLGVSDDGAIVGYATDGDISQTIALLDQAMSARGWSLLEMDTRGVVSYVWRGEEIRDADEVVRSVEKSAQGTNELAQGTNEMAQGSGDAARLAPQDVPRDAGIVPRDAGMMTQGTSEVTQRGSEAYVLFICSARSGGSSVVAQLL
jgi:X-X-X-Leu-X-X-Gly heptad repeat protein